MHLRSLFYFGKQHPLQPDALCIVCFIGLAAEWSCAQFCAHHGAGQTRSLKKPLAHVRKYFLNQRLPDGVTKFGWNRVHVQ